MTCCMKWHWNIVKVNRKWLTFQFGPFLVCQRVSLLKSVTHVLDTVVGCGLIPVVGRSTEVGNDAYYNEIIKENQTEQQKRAALPSLRPAPLLLSPVHQ